MNLTKALFAGFDEVGRGCLAGPVIAAAVIFPIRAYRIVGLTDSKKLSAKKRENLCALIKEEAIAWAIGRAEPSEIDQLNILQASLLAMRRASAALDVAPEHGLIDGSQSPVLPYTSTTLIGGDLTEPSISAASILAKVYRDSEMIIADGVFPGYGFALHKGYPTSGHREALIRLGPSPLHRASFKPVQACLADQPSADADQIIQEV